MSLVQQHMPNLACAYPSYLVNNVNTIGNRIDSVGKSEFAELKQAQKSKAFYCPFLTMPRHTEYKTGRYPPSAPAIYAPFPILIHSRSIFILYPHIIPSNTWVIIVIGRGGRLGIGRRLCCEPCSTN